MKTILFALALFLFTAPAFAADTPESVYDRVMRTGTIRCGYMVYPPYVDRDVNTGAFSGIWPEILEKLAAELSLKIEWAEEVGTADAFTALDAGRFDVLCTGALATPGRARVVNFTPPLYYDALYAVARADDNRFDKAYDRINDAGIKVFVLDGESAQSVVAQNFPKAVQVAQANLTDPASRFMDIVTGKGDVTLVTLANFQQFDKANPGKLKVVPGAPVWTAPAGIAVRKGEFDLWLMLGTAVQHLNNTGVTPAIIKKYGNILLPVAKPYEVKK